MNKAIKLRDSNVWQKTVRQNHVMEVSLENEVVRATYTRVKDAMIRLHWNMFKKQFGEN